MKNCERNQETKQKYQRLESQTLLLELCDTVNIVLLKLFSSRLKLADIKPFHKYDRKYKKENYRPVSILPTLKYLVFF